MKIKIKIILSILLFLSLFCSHIYANNFENKFSEIFESHKLVRIIIDAETGAIVLANKAAEDFYGYPREELLKIKIMGINRLTQEETIKEWKTAIEADRNYYISQHKASSSEMRDVEVHFEPFENKGRIYLYSLVIDITDKVALDKSLESSRKLTAYLTSLILIILLIVTLVLYLGKEKYKKLANYDYLTGAYSRLYLDEWKLKGVQSNNMEETNISIIMIDLKDFKCINDTHGHIVGDQVLKKITDTLKDCIREDDVVIRYGGDEFLLILYNTIGKHAEIVMSRVESKLKNTEEFDFPIEISYGIHETIRGADIFEVIKAADKEMYSMKNLNRS